MEGVEGIRAQGITELQVGTGSSRQATRLFVYLIVNLKKNNLIV